MGIGQSFTLLSGISETEMGKVPVLFFLDNPLAEICTAQSLLASALLFVEVLACYVGVRRQQTTKEEKKMRTVTVEEHFASPRFLDGPGRELRAQASTFGAAAAKLLERLCDVGEQRIAEMDDARIDMQVLSLTSPGTEQLEPPDAITVAREANQFLEEAAKKNPARFAGL